MPAPTKRFAALDTSFLLALAAGNGDCEAVVDWLSLINVYALVTGTVLQELADIEREESDPFINQNAVRAQQNIPTWGFLSIPLEPAENGITQIIARKIFEREVLPDECENDGLVIAEAAYQGCKVLVTYREILLRVSDEALKFILLESDVSNIFMVSPPDVVSYLDRRKSTSAGDSHT